MSEQEADATSLAGPAGTDRAPAGSVASTRTMWWRPLFLAPLLAFASLAVVLLIGLGRDASEIPSTLIGNEVPQFNLPPVQGRTLGLSSQNLVGRLSLVNVFASWCVACKAEHPVLMELATKRLLPIYGIDYKDQPTDAAAWLDTNGDPYSRTGADRSGRVGIDWGIYGVPESFLIGADGHVILRHVGPLTTADVEREIVPVVKQFEQVAKGRGQ